MQKGKTQSTNQEANIFEAIQNKYSILDVAKDIGLTVTRVGNSYRSDCIDGSGRGHNALHYHTDTNSWHDYTLGISGDITDLVAYAMFGEKSTDTIRKALQYLMPDWSNAKISEDIKAYEHFVKSIERWHNDLLDTSKNYAIRALDYLHSRRINDDTIRELNIGIDPSCCEFRILIPFWDETKKKILYFTSRRYAWRDSGEEDESRPRWKNASLEYYPFLHTAPLGLNSLKRKKNNTLIVTEGIFDWLAFYQEGYSVLAFKEKKFWKQSLDHIKEFSSVILAYDNDEAGQGYTYEAAKFLIQHKIPFSVAHMLTKDVAEHYQLTGNLDAIFASLINGLTWVTQYILPAKHYDELSPVEKEKAFIKCNSFIREIAIYADSAEVHKILISLKQYFPKDLVQGLFQIARKGPEQTEIRDKVISSHNIMYNPRTGFYEYQQPGLYAQQKGVWKQVDDETIMGYVSEKLGKFATGSKLTSILKLIKADQDVHSDFPVKVLNSKPCITFLNGTLHIDLNTGEAVLKPFSMYDYTTVQLPYYYDPDADCKVWKKFINDITNGRIDDQAVLQEYAGYTLLPHCKFQTALMLKGGGSNGKSVFFDIIKAILGGTGDDGRGYVSSTDPSKWGQDFRLMSLRHSWVNISYDMEKDMRGSEGVFKKVTAGEVLEDSYKHKDPISFNTRSKLMMACNYFPQVNDTSEGFMRRWLIVELPMHFVRKEKVRPFTNDRELDPFLEDKLMKELPGIFNWILAGLQRLLKQGEFTLTANHDRLINEFRTANNPLYAFVDENTEYFKGSDEGHIVERHAIFLRYAEWADKNKILPLPSNRFYSNMRSVFNSLSIPFDEDSGAWIFYFKEEGNW